MESKKTFEMLLHIYCIFVIINSHNVVENGLKSHESGGLGSGVVENVPLSIDKEPSRKEENGCR